jgi:hypothetical protein
LHYGRNKFGGEPKSFEEINELILIIEKAKMDSVERLQALEEF